MAAQQAPAPAASASPASPQPEVPVPAEPQTIDLNFIARDNHHARVIDLKPAEVQIFENGKPQVVKSLRSVALAAGEHREISLLIDSGSTESLALARNFAGSEFPESDSKIEVSIWDARQVNLIQPFTPNAGAVQSALAGGRVSTAIPDSAGAPQPAAQLTNQPAAQPENPVIRDARWKVENEHCRPWFASVYALIKEQGMVSARKEIVFFAANEDGGDVTEDQIRALASNATRAGVSIYVVEAAALSAEAEANAADIAAGAKKHASRKSAAPQKQNFLRELAERSGGAYLMASKGNISDFRRAAVEDLLSYDQLTYAPDQQAIDGQFRALTLKVSRPRISVRLPAGYFAVPPMNALDVEPFAPALLHALQTAGAKQDFPFEAQVVRFGEQEKRANAAILVEIPLSAMRGQMDSAGNSNLHFSVLTLVKSADGRVVCENDQDVPYEPKHGAQTYTFEGPVLLRPGDYHVEIAVRDENAETLSTKSLAFAIPARTSVDAASPELADIVVVRDAEPNAPSRHDGDPLRLGGTRIIPYASSSIGIAPGGMLPIFVTLYPGKAGRTPEVEMEVQRDDAAAVRLPLFASRDEAGRYRSLIWLPQDSLQPGHYTLTARAIDGQKTAEIRKVFELMAPGSASQIVEVASAGGPSVGAAENKLSDPPAPVMLLNESDFISSRKQLDADELKRILAGARDKALDYKRELPNFVCVEVTKRFTGRSGDPVWKTKDTIAELLGYTSGSEQYETLEVNGHPQRLDRTNFSGVRAGGEFGELLDAVYSVNAAAEFKPKGERKIDGVDAYVFDYKVPRERSIYGLSTTLGNTRVYTGFRGVVYIDEHTLNTRYISIQAEDVPPEALYRESTIAVNYDYFAVGGRKFLLPKNASLVVRIGKRVLMKNEMQFRSYRRYESKSRVLP